MTEKKKCTYQSDTLGLPPLRMVLVYAENERRNAALRPIPKPKAPAPSEQEVVLRIIEHLKKQQ